jgi:hypothetical protein
MQIRLYLDQCWLLPRAEFSHQLSNGVHSVYIIRLESTLSSQLSLGSARSLFLLILVPNGTFVSCFIQCIEIRHISSCFTVTAGQKECSNRELIHYVNVSLLQSGYNVCVYIFILGFEVITAVIMKGSIFWYITPCSLLKVNRRFGRTYLPFFWIEEESKKEMIMNLTLLDSISMLLSCLAYSSTLKMEATCYSETSVGSLRATRRYIPEHRTLHIFY